MDWALFEGTDFFLDMETSTPNTRRCRGEAMNYYAGDVEADEDYVTFFRDLLNVWDAKFVGEDDDEDDPHYKAFLENLKEHGNGYMCDVSIEHGVLSPLIYEVENNSPSPSPTEIKRKTPRARASACIPGKRKLYKGDRDSKYKSSGAKSDSHDKLKRRVKVVDDIKSGPRVRSDGIKRRSPLSGSGDCVRENRKSVRENRKSEVVDEVYGKFLNNLHVVEDFVFYEYGDGERVFYDTSDEQTMDVEIQPLKTITRPLMLNLRPPTLSLSPAPAPIPRPPTPSSREQIAQRKPIPHDRSMLSVSKETEECSSLWEELHNNLRQPYDQKEYDELWEIMSTRKPVSIHRDSRSGGSDRPGHMGKSYFDSYPDLYTKIEEVMSEPEKVLNLLRMLDFFLKKIPAGVSPPWLDDLSIQSCPEIILVD
ncbi:uncharacterized protein LOC104894414 isoform X2 [Beta vulgaris subsp. vulgaris]|uniref:uncharacterized protein LOC104894414 isoform X2 n=1 Tax=Beta vulgaris subsp. vulgaris TaxID=3555 RepID=UPI0005403617|nr:uncharacterized protein LOC104894414 isoform X2 [Beta vulgaris subsp. vulgaris]